MLLNINTEIIVVANNNRRGLIIPHLIGLPYQVSMTPNYLLPDNFVPDIQGFTHNHLGTYRCFKGHQKAISISEKDNVLIFEDDAVPKNDCWIDTINKAVPLLDDFDVVSFHGRDYNPNAFNTVSQNSDYIQPIIEKTWIVAALAYLISKRNFEKIKSYRYNGLPFDLLLYWNFRYCLIKDSPFIHNRSEGSLVD